MDVSILVGLVVALLAWLFVALVGGTVWVLFATRLKASGSHPFSDPQQFVAPDAPASGARAARQSSRADTDLAAEIADLKHAFKLLTNEWADKESRMDALIKRTHRLLKVEANGNNGAMEETPVPAAPLTREQVLAIYQARQAGKG